MQQIKSYQKLFPVVFKITFILLSVVVLLFIFIALYNLFLIKTIEIQGYGDLKGLAEIEGEFIVLINEDELENKLYVLNPEIQSVAIEKIFPSTIRLKIQKNNDLISLQVADGYYVINQKARIVAKNREAVINYPKMTYYQKILFSQYEIGKYLKISTIENALFFYFKLKDLGIYIDKINLVDENQTIFFEKEKQYVFSNDKSNELQTQELQIILNRFKIEKTNYQKIDLRFEKPVIVIE